MFEIIAICNEVEHSNMSKIMRLTQNQAFFIIEWILYFALCALSIFFIIQGEVFHKFLAQKTDFTQSEENITSRPMIFSRLSDPFGDDYLEAKLGTNYNISYWVYFRSTKKSYEVIAELKVGNNYYKIEDENHDGLLQVSVNPDNSIIIASLDKIDNSEDLVKTFHSIHYTFDESIINSDLVVRMSFFSGNYLGTDYDVSQYIEFLKPKDRTIIELSQEKSLHLNLPNHKCRSQSYFEDMIQKFDSADFSKCPRKCRPMEKDFGLDHHLAVHIDKCKSELENECSRKILIACEKKIIIKPCKKLFYLGNVIRQSQTKSQNTSRLWYHFSPPGNLIVHEEYLVFDMISLISSVGGTLGFFIGFSFTNLVKYAMTFLKQLFNKTNSWMRDPRCKHEYLDGQNIPNLTYD